MNRKIHDTTLINLERQENWIPHSSCAGAGISTAGFNSGREASPSKSGLLGHPAGYLLSQGGSDHHRSSSRCCDGALPLESESGGLTPVAIFLQCPGGTLSTICPTLLNTNTLSLEGDVCNQPSTTAESVHAKTDSVSRPKSAAVLDSSLERSNALQPSNLGMVSSLLSSLSATNVLTLRHLHTTTTGKPHLHKP